MLEFKANRLGEKLTQSITIDNPISDTLLEGRWEVAPHPQDPPHTPDDHAWISVTPAQFSGNHTRCQVEVDTGKLMADKQYKRQLILHSNAYPATHTLTVKVQTAALPIEKREVPYAWLSGVLIICAITSVSMTWFITVAGLGVVITAVIGAVGGALSGALSGIFLVGMMFDLILGLLFDSYGNFGMKMMGVMGFFVGLPIGAIWLLLNTHSKIEIGIGIGVGIGIWIIFMLLAVWRTNIFINQYKIYPYTWTERLKSDADLRNIAMLSLLTAALGTNFGIICIVGLINLYILFALAGTGLPLVSILLYSPLKRRRLIAKYRQSEESLIKP